MIFDGASRFTVLYLNAEYRERVTERKRERTIRICTREAGIGNEFWYWNAICM